MLDLELFKDIVIQAKPLGLNTVKLTGGEPLLHPEIQMMLDFIRQKKVGLTIETNGILCTPELAKKMASCSNVFVSVSLDGSDAQTNDWIRGVPGSYKKILKGIGNLVEAGLKPQIILTLMNRNKDHMEAVVRLAESLGAASVKFNVLQPTARGEKMHKSGESLTIEELIELGDWTENTLSPSTPLTVIYSQPPAFRSLGNMFGSKSDGRWICGILSILGVLSNGSYALCGIGETVPELIFGDASKDRLKDVWEKSPVLTELREGMPGHLKGICQECLVKQHCLGNCIAQNYYRSKDIWGAYWFCEDAERSGLFPKTRKKGKKPPAQT
jgi:SynChlorMet cassette radical SAM/SPASM protein ScmF